VFIDTSFLENYLSVDVQNQLITVSAGMTIADVNTKAAQYDLALPTQAYLTSATIAGALSTTTHGSGNVKVTILVMLKD
jgi:FAD/FMN-containing dehydrogenase